MNSTEDFWSQVKNGIRGSYRSISPKYLPYYLIEYEWKYNHRNYRGNDLELFLKNALQQEKELEYWKAESLAQVKKLMETNETNGLILLILASTFAILLILKTIFYGLGHIIDKITDAESHWMDADQ